MTRSGVILSLIGVALASGCGKVASKTPDSDMAMTANGDLATSAGDLATSAGDLDVLSSCIGGTACQYGNGYGLCDGTNCNGCNDDPSCAKVYGMGTICLNNACVTGACRSSNDCGGMPCINNQCTPCSVDNDCSSSPNQVCDTATHACVTNLSCGGAADNTTCPVNPGDVCCSAACVPGNCCGSGSCTVVTAGDGMCVGGSCQRTSGCTAAVAGTRYVDPTAAAGGNGSQSCPYIHISSAVNDLAAAGGTVILKGGTTSALVGSQAVAARINIIGSDGSFAPCTLGTCSNPSAWPKINETNNAIGFEFETSGARAVSFLQLLGPSALPSPTASGFHISNTATVTLSHVQVSSFKDGIYVATGATATINAGLVATGNAYAGLYVDSGGIADVEAVTGDATIRFDNNTNTADSNSFGIYAESGSKLTVNGPTSPPLLIEAINNKLGVRFYSAVAGSSITGMLVGPNSLDNLYLYAKATLKVRGSQFISSTTGNGVHVVANGTNIATGLSLIDFGTSYTSDPGNNTFSGNGLTGFCIDAAPAVAATNDSLSAQGNNWGGGVTCGATNAGQLKDSASCTAGQDVSDDCTGAITAGHCSASKCAP